MSAPPQLDPTLKGVPTVPAAGAAAENARILAYIFAYSAILKDVVIEDLRDRHDRLVQELREDARKQVGIMARYAAASGRAGPLDLYTYYATVMRNLSAKYSPDSWFNKLTGEEEIGDAAPTLQRFVNRRSKADWEGVLQGIQPKFTPPASPPPTSPPASPKAPPKTSPKKAPVAAVVTQKLVTDIIALIASEPTEAGVKKEVWAWAQLYNNNGLSFDTIVAEEKWTDAEIEWNVLNLFYPEFTTKKAWNADKTKNPDRYPQPVLDKKYEEFLRQNVPKKLQEWYEANSGTVITPPPKAKTPPPKAISPPPEKETVPPKQPEKLPVQPAKPEQTDVNDIVVDGIIDKLEGSDPAGLDAEILVWATLYRQYNIAAMDVISKGEKWTTDIIQDNLRLIAFSDVFDTYQAMVTAITADPEAYKIGATGKGGAILKGDWENLLADKVDEALVQWYNTNIAGSAAPPKTAPKAQPAPKTTPKTTPKQTPKTTPKEQPAPQQKPKFTPPPKTTVPGTPASMTLDQLANEIRDIPESEREKFKDTNDLDVSEAPNGWAYLFAERLKDETLPEIYNEGTGTAPGREKKLLSAGPSGAFKSQKEKAFPKGANLAQKWKFVSTLLEPYLREFVVQYRAWVAKGRPAISFAFPVAVMMPATKLLGLSDAQTTRLRYVLDLKYFNASDIVDTDSPQASVIRKLHKQLGSVVMARNGPYNSELYTALEFADWADVVAKLEKQYIVPLSFTVGGAEQKFFAERRTKLNNAAEFTTTTAIPEVPESDILPQEFRAAVRTVGLAGGAKLSSQRPNPLPDWTQAAGPAPLLAFPTLPPEDNLSRAAEDLEEVLSAQSVRILTSRYPTAELDALRKNTDFRKFCTAQRKDHLTALRRALDQWDNEVGFTRSPIVDLPPKPPRGSREAVEAMEVTFFSTASYDAGPVRDNFLEKAWKAHADALVAAMSKNAKYQTVVQLPVLSKGVAQLEEKELNDIYAKLGRPLTKESTVAKRRGQLATLLYRPVSSYVERKLRLLVALRLLEELEKWDYLTEYDDDKDVLYQMLQGTKPAFSSIEEIKGLSDFFARDGIASLAVPDVAVPTPLYMAIDGRGELLGWALWTLNPSAVSVLLALTASGKDTKPESMVNLRYLCASQPEIAQLLYSRGAQDAAVLDGATHVVAHTVQQPDAMWAGESTVRVYAALDPWQSRSYAEAGLYPSFNVSAKLTPFSEQEYEEATSLMVRPPQVKAVRREFSNLQSYFDSVVALGEDVPASGNAYFDGLLVPYNALMPRYSYYIEHRDTPPPDRNAVNALNPRIVVGESGETKVLSDKAPDSSDLDNDDNTTLRQDKLEHREKKPIFYFVGNLKETSPTASAAAVAYASTPGTDIAQPYVAPSAEIQAVLNQLKILSSQ